MALKKIARNTPGPTRMMLYAYGIAWCDPMTRRVGFRHEAYTRKRPVKWADLRRSRMAHVRQ